MYTEASRCHVRVCGSLAVSRTCTRRPGVARSCTQKTLGYEKIPGQSGVRDVWKERPKQNRATQTKSRGRDEGHRHQGDGWRSSTHLVLNEGIRMMRRMMRARVETTTHRLRRRRPLGSSSSTSVRAILRLDFGAPDPS